MRKIDYSGIDKAKLESAYISIFSSRISAMNSYWPNLRDDLRAKSTSSNANDLYPDTISAYFTMSYPKLVDTYLDYHQIMGNNSRPKYPMLHRRLKNLFNYSGGLKDCGPMQPLIAEFFMMHSAELKIHVCYYCETAYINTYGFSSTFDSFSEFLMTASRKQIRHYVTKSDGKPCADKTIEKIMELRLSSTFSSIVNDFDALGIWRNPTVPKSRQLQERKKNHFDLDHFLPKSECPLVGLSLYNFVPSCPVCNEKLKRSSRLGGLDKAKLLMLSPTSDAYDFDNTSNIAIIPKDGASMLKTLSHPSDFHLEFLHSGVYQESVEKFALDERYNYHKCEALRLYDLYQDYSPAKIRMLEIMFLFSKSKDDIMDDIFGVKFSDKQSRCFDKMKRDITRQCGR